MRKLAILHFNPIELYPPVLNWLNFLADQKEATMQVKVYTMQSGGSSTSFTARGENIRIVRMGSSGKKGIIAYLNYLAYYAGTLFRLIIWQPDTVLYYETLSSFPAFIFKKYIRRRSSLFIHYHEYTSVNEYEHGMILSRWFHRLEKKLYFRAEGVSHTNAERIALFKKDLGGILLPPLYALPNYPPASWEPAGREKSFPDLQVKMVYVGAMSLDTMYVREMAEWVVQQKGKIVWDIYSDNITEEARAFLESFENDLIRFRKGVNYYSLPGILMGYDVGVILYKGHIPNYIYNAPNKLFEYMACGLDVWFPDVMLGCHPYITQDVYPKVISLDFDRLGQWDFLTAIGRSGLVYNPSVYYAEKALPELLRKMIKFE
jgi:hypothetical protein